MGLYILRLIVIAVCAWAGAVIGLTQGGVVAGAIGAAVATVIGGLLCISDRYLRTVPLWTYLYGLAGLTVGLFAGILGNYLLGKLPIQDPAVVQVLSLPMVLRRSRRALRLAGIERTEIEPVGLRLERAGGGHRPRDAATGELDGARRAVPEFQLHRHRAGDAQQQGGLFPDHPLRSFRAAQQTRQFVAARYECHH